MKDKKAKGVGRFADGVMLNIRVTPAEKLRLKNQAQLAGIPLSEYVRRNFFGGKPLVTHTDLKVFMELRRIGGLLKHNFVLLRETGTPEVTRANMDAAFNDLQKLLGKIGYLFHASQKN